jgi:hypothetical protein
MNFRLVYLFYFELCFFYSSFQSYNDKDKLQISLHFLDLVKDFKKLLKYEFSREFPKVSKFHCKKLLKICVFFTTWILMEIEIFLVSARVSKGPETQHASLAISDLIKIFSKILLLPIQSLFEAGCVDEELGSYVSQMIFKLIENPAHVKATSKDKPFVLSIIKSIVKNCSRLIGNFFN